MSFHVVSSFNKALMMIFLIVMLSTTIIMKDGFGHVVPHLDKQESFIVISDEKFNRQSLKNGQTITIDGELIAKDEININKPLSVYLETDKLCNALNVFFTEPKGVIGHVNKGDKIPYQIKFTLDSGVYHVHTMINIESFGQALGPGLTLVVEDSSDSPKTSELCDESNNNSIIIGISFIAITVIMGIFVLKRKTDSKTTSRSQYSIMLIVLGFMTMGISLMSGFEFGIIPHLIGFGIGGVLIIVGLALNPRLNKL
jgi:hypothetical protein